MVIAGCSHSVGSEIDGQQDSLFNRQHSFGNLLAEKLGYRPINIAVCGYTNSAIARSVLEWFHVFSKNINDINNLEIFTLIGWTESSRIEAPFQFPTWHNEVNGKYCDWFSKSSTDFLQINVSYKGYSSREKEIQNDYHDFIIKRTEFTEVYSANLILQMQYFLKLKKSKYLMVNTGHMFSKENEKYLRFYMEQIDRNHYYKFDNNQSSFFIKYKDLGYENNNAKFGHHGTEPHKLYAEELYQYIGDTQNETH